MPTWRSSLRWRRWRVRSEEIAVAALIAVQRGSDLRWWRGFVVVAVVVEVVERRSLKLRVRLLRAKLERALEQEVAKVRSVRAVEVEVQLVKLSSRSA